MAKRIKSPFTALFPVPVVMVTCVDEGGKPNIITLAWVGMVCSEPPQIGISVRPSRYSHGLISKIKEFVVNIPTEDQAAQADYCGMVSGREVDKFKGANLTPEPASQVKPPLIGECPVNIECRVKETLSLGTHDLFIGQVVAVHLEEAVLNERGRIDVGKVRPFSYNQEEYWALREKIGFYGYTKKK